MGAVPSSTLPPHTETDTGTSTATPLIGAVCSTAVVVLLVTVFVTIGILVKLRANAKQKSIKATYLPQKTERPTQAVPKPIIIDINSSYAPFSQSGTADETVTYSYVPKDSDQHHSWKAATHIPINSNEAYATKQSSPKSNTAPEEGDYVVNSLVYESVDRELKRDGTCSDGDHDVSQLNEQHSNQDEVDFEILTTNEAYVCSNEMVERDTEHSKQDVMDIEILTTNEAYVSSNDVMERDTQYSKRDVMDDEMLTTNEAYVCSNQLVLNPIPDTSNEASTQSNHDNKQ